MNKMRQEKDFKEHDEAKKRERFIKNRDEKRILEEEFEDDDKYYNYEWLIK